MKKGVPVCPAGRPSVQQIRCAALEHDLACELQATAANAALSYVRVAATRVLEGKDSERSRRIADVVAWCPEEKVVQDVKRRHTQLQRKPFAQRRVLLHGEVHGVRRLTVQ